MNALLFLLHLIHVKEKYEEIKMVFNLLNYQKYNWIIYVDLEMVNWDNKVVTPSTPAFYVFGTVKLKNDIGCKESGRSVKS